MSTIIVQEDVLEFIPPPLAEPMEITPVVTPTAKHSSSAYTTHETNIEDLSYAITRQTAAIAELSKKVKQYEDDITKLKEDGAERDYKIGKNKKAINFNRENWRGFEKNDLPHIHKNLTLYGYEPTHQTFKCLRSIFEAGTLYYGQAYEKLTPAVMDISTGNVDIRLHLNRQALNHSFWYDNK